MYADDGGIGNPGYLRATAPGRASEPAAQWPPQRTPMGQDDDQMRRDDRRHGSRRQRGGDNASPPYRDNVVNIRRHSPSCFVTVWAFCFVSVATLAVPVAFFLLPFIKATLIVSTQEDFVRSRVVTDRTTATTITSTKTIAETLPTPATTDAPRPTGLDCQKHLPFALCPNIVYWSWSLPGGNLTSRAKEFDERHGLAIVQEAARNQSTTVNVFLALGGYPEDSGDFHALGKDPTVQHRLVQDVYRTYRRYNLSGIALHWVSNERVCESAFGEGVPRLGEFIDSLRLLISLNEDASPFKIAAIVDTRELREMELFRFLRNRLNITFFKTHNALPPKDFDDYCANSGTAFQNQVERIKPFFRPPIHRAGAPNLQIYDGLCISMSLALNARQGSLLEWPAPPQPVSATEGYMALFEACDSQLSFDDVVRNRPGCVVRKTSGPYLNVTYAFDDLGALKNKMSNLGDRTELCVLLYDIDFDNYRTECRQQVVAFSRYLMLQYFYCARVDTDCFNMTLYLP